MDDWYVPVKGHGGDDWKNEFLVMCVWMQLILFRYLTELGHMPNC